jgi:LysM repeat protein
LLCALFPYRIAVAQEPFPTAAPMIAPNPADIINAVNSLRLSKGLRTLAVHPVLMQVAQEQANGIASGLPGHWRPNGMTLGQWLIFSGYPLSGDLSLDGYRSENWVAASSVEEAMSFWSGDDEHINTMLSVDRSDLGVGVAVSDQIYMVLETALQTGSGQMQSAAGVFLTGIPMTQAAYSVDATQAAENGTIPQYLLPVKVNTPMPNGDVYHEVQYGQTLWSIAVKYNTTIKQIQQLNNLHSTTVNIGQNLLVLEGVTQPASSAAVTPAAITMIPAQVDSQIYSVQALGGRMQEGEPKDNTLVVAAIAFAALFLGGMFTVMARRKTA